MARPTRPAAQIPAPSEIRPEIIQDIALVDADNFQRRERACALAVEVQYDGELSVSALDDGIRLYMRRTVEDCLELGKRLLLRRELTPHGEWLTTMERVGMGRDTAERFMRAALRTSKSRNLRHLVAHAASPSAMLELLVLDDEQAAGLLEGETVAGLQLDDIATAPASELRRRLREALADGSAKDKVLADKSAAIDKRDTELARLRAERDQQSLLVQVPTIPADAMRAQLLAELTRRALDIEHQIRRDLGEAIRAVLDHLDAQDDPEPVDDLLAGAVGQIARAVDEFRHLYGVDEAPTGRIPGAEIWDLVNAELDADPSAGLRTGDADPRETH